MLTSFDRIGGRHAFACDLFALLSRERKATMFGKDFWLESIALLGIDLRGGMLMLRVALREHDTQSLRMTPSWVVFVVGEFLLILTFTISAGSWDFWRTSTTVCSAADS